MCPVPLPDCMPPSKNGDLSGAVCVLACSWSNVCADYFAWIRGDMFGVCLLFSLLPVFLDSCVPPSRCFFLMILSNFYGGRCDFIWSWLDKSTGVIKLCESTIVWSNMSTFSISIYPTLPRSLPYVYASTLTPLLFYLFFILAVLACCLETDESRDILIFWTATVFCWTFGSTSID